MKKVVIKAPKYTDSKHSSQQALVSQRMPARIFKDKKKEMKKNRCRRGSQC